MNKLLIELLIYFRVAVTVVPIVGVYSNSIVNIVSFLLLYALVISEIGINQVISVIKNNILIFSLFFLTLFVNVINNSGFFNTVYELFMNLLWPVCFYYIATLENQKTTFRILCFVLLCYVVTSITTYIGCSTFEGAARHMSNSNFAEENPELMKMYQSVNIGTFTFIYSLAVLFPLIVYVIRCHSELRKIFIPIAIVIVAVILKTEYSTALIILMTSFALFFLPKSFNARTLTKYSFLLVALLAIFSSVTPFIVDIVVGFSESEQVADRLNSLLLFQSSGQIEVGSDFEQRTELWGTSIKLFFSNIIFGTLEKSGGHSFIFDNMAKFGLFGLIANIIIFKKMYSQHILPYKAYAIYGYMLFCLCLNVLQCIVNPVINYMGFTFILPLTALFFNTRYQ